MDDGWPVPHELTVAEMAGIRDAFVAATRRALTAGFDVVEVHAAHGYLLNQFLSPLTNRRTDGYGGSAEARMRFPLEVVEAVRAAWPADRPLFVRVSAVDGSADGMTLEDTVAFARELAARGVDAVHTSGGGLGGGWAHPIGYGYQVPFAERIRDRGRRPDDGRRADHRGQAGRGGHRPRPGRPGGAGPRGAGRPELRRCTRRASSPAAPTTPTRCRPARGWPRATGCSPGSARGPAPTRCR